MLKRITIWGKILRVPILLLAVFAGLNAFGPNLKSEEELEDLNPRVWDFASLKSEFGQNKALPPGYELQALLALAHYPALRNEDISFEFVNSPFAHTSTLDFKSILLPWQKRKYRIYISTDLPGELKNTLFTSLPPEAQVGVLGHELAHTLDYRQRSNLGLFLLGIKYQFTQIKKEFELKTDLLAIRHGLGCQVLAWSEAVHDLLAQDGRGELYLSPEQISLILEYPERDFSFQPVLFSGGNE
ncbi:MAG: hypothetical protein H6581_09415 [Bacteroidia bacterium]|nr:hypothetical protein [Bacteroidia bacterium]